MTEDQFHNIPLKHEEFIAILNLETKINHQIEFFDRCDYEGIVFNAKDTHIIGLSLCDCGLEKIPEEIGLFEELMVLTLNNNQIKIIDDWISKCQKLTYLSVKNNQISVIPDSLSNLLNLKELNLMSNNIDNVPQSVSFLSSLEKLNLSMNKLSTIQIDENTLENLDEIRLAHNMFECIPEDVLKRKEMFRVNMESNRISSLPDMLGEKRRTRFYLYNNKVRIYSPDIFKNPNVFYDITTFEQGFEYREPERDYDKFIPKSRKFVKLTVDQLAQKLVDCEIIYPEVEFLYYKYYKGKIDLQNPKLAQYYLDLSWLDFSFENNEVGRSDIGFPKEILGFHTLENGLTYLGTLSGGDWESGVFHITYWDGEHIRGYIPIHGNPWDRTNKTAFGNSGFPELNEKIRQSHVYGLPFNINNSEELDNFEDKLINVRDITDEILNVFFCEN